MNVKALSLMISLAMFLLIIELIRREKLTFKYALAWLIISFMAIFFAICHQCLFKISVLLGFVLPSNFIFFTLLCGFMFLSLLMTIFLCQQNVRNDKIAQRLGLVEFELEQYKNKFNQ